MPLVSVIIPTNRSPERLLPCLQSLAMQDFDRTEIAVHVAYNGVDRAPDVSPCAWPLRVQVTHRREPNIGAAKNQAIEAATGEYLLLLNDDVIARPDFVRTHVETHRKLAQPAMVLGKSVWERYRDQTVLDEMIAATPMVFFYDLMAGEHWYGFRHAWNLNLSLPRAALGRLRFDERLGPFFYEDLELAYRLGQQHGVRVWYQPGAEVLHAHRYTFDGYLDRECSMGSAAVRLADTNPDCFRAIYGAALDDDYLRFMRAAVQHDGRHESQRAARLRQWAMRPALALPTDVEARQEMLDLLYDAHLPLKRLAFRRGVLAATEKQPRAAAPQSSDRASVPDAGRDVSITDGARQDMEHRGPSRFSSQPNEAAAGGNSATEPQPMPAVPQIVGETLV